MRVPLSLDDRDLLKDEPFLSQFLARKISGPDRRGAKVNHLFTARAVRGESGGETAAQAWLDMAFFANESESAKIQEMKITVNDHSLEVFVEFFWLLFEDQDALVFLNSQRKKTGFRYSLDVHNTEIATRGESASRNSAVGRATGKHNPPQLMHSPVTMMVGPIRTNQPADRPKHKPATALPPFVLNPVAVQPLKILGAVGGRQLDTSASPGLQVLENTLPAEGSNNWICDHDSEHETSDENSDDGPLLAHMRENRPSVSPIDHIPQFKPPLHRSPPIWAQSRQEICESFDWFRSYQSGVYHSNNVVKGYLLSAFASSRDRFDHGGRLIISHGGGKSESLHSRKGRTEKQLADDQLAQDRSVRALLKNHRDRRPLVLLIDDKYVLFPYDLGASDITYAVLGFFNIVHAWAEYQPATNERGRVVRYKFAFQWCEGQGEPWWILRNDEMVWKVVDNPTFSPAIPACGPSATTLPIARHIPEKLEDIKFSDLRPQQPDDLYFQCGQCGEKTPRVYRRGWVCLNPECTVFWTTQSGHLLPDQLIYYPKFLEALPSLPLPLGFQDLRPSPPATFPINGITTTYAFSRGWHCVNCGRLSSRFKWEHWECATCASVLKIPGRIREAKEFRDLPVPVAFFDHSIAKGSGIVQLPTKTFSHGKGVGHYQSFILPNQSGRIHHIQGGRPPGNLDADIIFKEYQEQASDGRLVFRRWPLRTHKLRGPLLTNYFSQNSGEPYQYVGGTENTVPFEKTPSAVIKARKLIQDRISQALDRSTSFNEVLSAAYMERQKMAFHSDSERGLGSVVAGLSLGSPALMHFRLHAKHEPNKENRKIALSFVLRHGDVLVMEGNGVQDCYEHTVVPANFRIAATARWIAPMRS